MSLSVIGGSCHKYNFCCDNKHMFVVTKHVFCHDKSMLVVTKLCDKHIFVMTKDLFIVTNTFVTTNTELLLRWQTYLWQLLCSTLCTSHSTHAPLYAQVTHHRFHWVTQVPLYAQVTHPRFHWVTQVPLYAQVTHRRFQFHWVSNTGSTLCTSHSSQVPLSE